MTMKETVRQVVRGSAVLVVVLLAACVPPATHPTPVAAPMPCADASYVALRQQHLDSLSEREWQRLQTLDSQCAAAHVQAPRDTHGMLGTEGGHGVHMMGVGIVASVIMLAMMIGHW